MPNHLVLDSSILISLDRKGKLQDFLRQKKKENYKIIILRALVANTSGLRAWTGYPKNCWGINLPIDLNPPASLIQNAIGKHVDKIEFPIWDDVANKTVQVYLT